MEINKGREVSATPFFGFLFGFFLSRVAGG